MELGVRECQEERKKIVKLNRKEQIYARFKKEGHWREELQMKKKK